MRWLIACALLAGTPLIAQERGSQRAALDSAARLDSLAGQAAARGKRDDLVEAARLFGLAADLYDRAGAGGKQGEAVANAGSMYNAVGRSDSAIVNFRRALPLLRAANDRENEGATLILLGQAFHGRGELDSALAYYREGLTVARATGNRKNEGVLLNNFGIAYNALGRPDSAIAYLTRALTVRRELKDRLGEGVTLNNLARVEQTLGRYESAITYLRQSLVARREVKDRAGEGTTLNNIGFAFDLLHRPDSALVYYRQALVPLREVGRRPTIAITLTNIGRAYTATGKADSALAYIREGLATARDVGDKTGESWALVDLGNAFDALNQPDSALASYRAGLAVLRTVGDRSREGDALSRIGFILQRSGSAQLKSAVAYYDSAASVRAAVGSSAGGDANRLTFAEQDVHLFERWALAWLARGPEVGDQVAARASLAAVERGRAQALLDLLRDSRRGAGRATTPQAPSVAPGADLAVEGETLARTVSQTAKASLTFLSTQDTLIAWLIDEQGGVAVARSAVSQDSIAALVATLRAGLAVDDAAIGSRVAMRGSPPLETPAPSPGPTERTYRRGLRYAEPAAVALAGLLIPEAFVGRLPKSGELVIVAPGPLALLPFATLPLGRTNTLASPFGNGLAIRYAPSLAALAESERRPAAIASREPAALRATLKEALVVGNPSMPSLTSFDGRAVALAPLPAAGAEAAWVAGQLGATALTGAQATESGVRQRLPEAPIVHLATHGYAYASGERARQSFVALAPGEGNDGLLTVGEMLDTGGPALRAELVVLSACQTGLGDLKQAEGTVGLQRAFLGRGARSVLVSLWSVGDAATEALMKRFYTHWLHDRDAPTKAEALRRAQEDVRKMAGFDHPRFWAGFQLVGAR